MKYYLSMIAFLFAGLLMAQNSDAEKPIFKNNEIYIRLGAEVPGAAGDEISFELGFSILSQSNLPEVLDKYGVVSIEKAFATKSEKLSGVIRVKTSGPVDIRQFVAEVSSIPEVDHAQPSYLYYINALPNDAHPEQWWLESVQMSEAFDLFPELGDSSIKVAIVDDAVMWEHPDLEPVIYVNSAEIDSNGIDDDGNGFIDDIRGYDVADMDGNTTPPTDNLLGNLLGAFTHGTHTSGCAAAATNNNEGVASLGAGISIIPVKATEDTILLPLAISKAVEGVDYAIQAGANIISMSYGGPEFDQLSADIIAEAQSRGIICVAAAGNDGEEVEQFPANYPGVFAIASSDRGDVMSDFTTYHPNVVVSAPGTDIYSTVRFEEEPYQLQSGTSMATPITAGLIGLMMSYDSTATNEDIRNCLIIGAENNNEQNPVQNPDGTYQFEDKIGVGRINAYRSLYCMTDSVAPIARMHASFQGFNYCFGEEVSIQFFNNSVAEDEVFWDFGNGNTSTEMEPIAVFTESGEYEVTMIASNNFGSDTFSRTVVILEIAPDFDLVSEFEIKEGENTLELTTDTEGDQFTWNVGGTNYTGRTVTVEFAEEGTYEVVLTVVDGDCSESLTKEVVVTESETNVSVNEPISTEISVYPNPVESVVTITSTLPIEEAIMLDLNGKAVKRFSLISGENRIDISMLESGVYFLQAGGISVQKIIKQ